MIQSNQIHRFAAPVAVLRYFIELIHKNHQKSPKQLHSTGRHSAAVVRFGRADGSADGSPSSALRDHLPMTATSVEAH